MEKEDIIEKSRNNNAFSKVLFDFESFKDTKIGFIKYIEKHSLDSKFVNKEFVSSNLDYLKFYHMNFLDIIEKCFKEDSIAYDNAYNLYNEAMEKHYEELLDLSPITTMPRLLTTYTHVSEDSIHCFILCKNQFEKDYITKFFPFPIVIDNHSSRSEIKAGEYGRIIIPYSDMLYDFPEPIMQNFLILNYRENMSKENPKIFDERILKDFIIPNSLAICNSFILKPEGD